MNAAYRILEHKIILFILKYFKPDPQAKILELKDIKRNKDTIFIFGSGYSINEISDYEWATIRETGDSIAFNCFSCLRDLYYLTLYFEDIL